MPKLAQAGLYFRLVLFGPSHNDPGPPIMTQTPSFVTTTRQVVIDDQLSDKIFNVCIKNWKAFRAWNLPPMAVLTTCRYITNKFYQVFCGAVVDQFAAMDAILIWKEPFALQIMMFSCWKMSLGTYLLIAAVQATSISASSISLIAIPVRFSFGGMKSFVNSIRLPLERAMF
ncbi:hypothetical protein TEA_028027 [Camellia sinensis var. sinensis]|uniref:Uncharacterized protein n=1 Tax=Camellia sinensis var. sinensis TaxID=542762 RepID=A0A4S4CXJ6_CAMSN|nr:hypothetical protein TEA_028027 [Camellia sinensis var. sinensis]